MPSFEKGQKAPVADSADAESETTEKPYESDPDYLRSPKTPKDIMVGGKSVGYYDTKAVLWKMGDRSNPSFETDEAFTSREELVAAIQAKYGKIDNDVTEAAY